MSVYRLAWLVLLALAIPHALAAQGAPVDPERVAALEAQLRAAENRVAELEGTLAMLAADIASLKDQANPVEIGGRSGGSAVDTSSARDGGGEYSERIVVPDLGGDDRDEELQARPELFVQTAYFANAIDGAATDDVALNFAVNRMELRWAGRVAERIGMGYELQYHPAPEGAAEELINDAYIEYYASDSLTLRAGQFIKPFGFDLQHSTSARESPERGMFAGYFFPGQRDRGLMLNADLAGLAGWLRGTSLQAGVFNGNRFFADNNNATNYNLRLRKVFPSQRLAVGASIQAGTQILPPGVTGTDDEDAYGADLQFAAGRLGIRGEYVRGNSPSTLLGLEPDFVPAFVPGAETWGATAFFNYNLSAANDLYWRWDHINNDPVTGENIRAFNVGYLRRLGSSSRLGFDYQWKDGVTSNDDELNTKFSIRWDVLY